ncbi:peptidase [Cellulomonas edaphi]|uniref:Peptidase n=1 Tax=Cellulomonas edaphi TaxID=3053468 RepID=A0ABT7S4N2_9CELL|nr:peptidase [Cellulomons edaphi]MDM7830583.1 peptidase [Cellulomons edaphi]
MARTAKACLAAVAALALMLLAPGAALAATSAASVPAADASPSPTGYGCIDGEDEYGAPLPCELKIQVLNPICDNNVPKLQYQVEAVGSPNTTVKITWINPDGDDVVQSGLPLSGTVLWPGAVQGANGEAIDWPGWRLENGVWVEGDEFDWVRPSVKVLFQVNPEMSVSVAYPPSSPACLTSPPDTQVLVDNPLPPGEIAATGSNVAPLLIGGAALVVVGAGAVLLVNRQRRTQA